MNVNLIPIVLALIASICASFVGLKQKIIWAFMGGFVASELARPFINMYARNILSLYGYGVFISCIVGIACAIFVHLGDHG